LSHLNSAFKIFVCTQTHTWLVLEVNKLFSNSKLLDIEEGPDWNPRRPDGWCFGQLEVQTEYHVVGMDVAD
jgi:hypothetical protein